MLKEVMRVDIIVSILEESIQYLAIKYDSCRI